MSLEDRPRPDAAPGPEPGQAPAPMGPGGPRRRPILSWAIVALCVAVYALEAMVLGDGEGQMARIGMLHGPDVQSGQLWLLFTHVFEHGGVIHLVFNMSAVLAVGTLLERAVGHGVFALVSFITAMGSATLSLLLSFDVYMLGASGMIIGWLGAILPIATAEGRRLVEGWLVQVALITALPLIALILGFENIIRISWQGHLGGFLFGLPCGFLLKHWRSSFLTMSPFLVAASLGAALVVTHPALH